MAPALNTPSCVPTMLSDVRMLNPSHAPSTNRSLQLSLCSFSFAVFAGLKNTTSLNSAMGSMHFLHFILS